MHGKNCAQTGCPRILKEGVPLREWFQPNSWIAIACCGHKIPYRINVQLLEAQYRCANCLNSYANVFWIPRRARPMQTEHRKAFARRYMERRRG
jgi:hypothetical protein